MLSAADFLSKSDRDRVAEAIRDAESITSGEIRVHLEDHIEDGLLEHAAFVFEELGMQHTRERNGVLVYISVADRLVAVIGDKGINERVPEGFWDSTVKVLEQRFARDERAEGLCEVVRSVGKLLAQHFPSRKDDRNELSNEVSVGNR